MNLPHWHGDEDRERKSIMVEEEESTQVDLPCRIVSVRGASALFSGKLPLHMYMGSLYGNMLYVTDAMYGICASVCKCVCVYRFEQ